ncbi:MAG TPA: amino acid adenylation domain-containing protein [Chitinophaga sp.]|uniref:non-ribosomal peptide synthetase n=1 Tax=Chitinophaga sp. TaxID=1869181 RepID=UPI002D008426|nr:non-ribosomal peptide synthetase [Chitinophaga sp.]HVI45635.1 amino acid adenylation domain-containing protein [Chitinophaga sp.]
MNTTTLQYKIATDYWLGKTGRLELPEISAINIAAATPGYRTSSLLLEEATAATLKKVCKDQDAGIYAFLATALYILIHKYTGAEELLIASPAPVLSNGNGHTSPLFLTADIRKGATVKQLLQSFQEELKEAYKHRDYPFEKFAEKYQGLVGAPESLFSYALSYLPLTGENNFNDSPRLSFNISKTAASFELQLQYAGSYTEWFATQVCAHYARILDFIVHHPVAAIAEIPLLSSEEKQLLLETFNDSDVDFPEKDLTILTLFEKQAQLHPNQPAVQFAGTTLSYKALQQHALQLAAQLKAKGIGPKDIVALVCDRSERMIIGMLGILKTGAAYLPIDADFPDERIQFILKDSAAKLVLTTQNIFNEKQHCFTTEAILLDRINGEGKLTDFSVKNSPEDPVYVIYTSGSTGQPKGIVVKQSGVTNFVLGYKTVFEKGFDTTDRVMALANISFDASIAEIFIALTSGSTLVILDKERLFDAAKLAAFLRDEKITYAYVPPVLLKDLYHQLQQAGSDIALRKLFVGVEPIKDTLLYDYCSLIKGLDVINAYGPTETTVIASVLRYKPVTPSGENVTIGKPIPNYKVYILNDALEPVPVGIPGEICIAGPGITQGYLNNKELTASKFINHPFHKGQRMYLSGDLARWTPDGNIVFIGRKDNQVKIRGYRIEPGEIAAVLLDHPAVKEAVVCPFNDDMGSKYLCAYYVPSATASVADLRAWLAARLPEYMIPARFMMLDKIPVTSNGKTDRRKLPLPENEQRTLTADDMPANPLEEKLLGIWKELLGIQLIGVNDNFFELGGHSLKAAKLLTIILQDLHVEVPLRQVFSSGNIRRLAAYIQQAEKTVQFEIPVATPAAHYPAAFAQRGIYLSYLLNKDSINYNMPSMFAVEGKTDIKKLEQALATIIDRHAILRTGFNVVDEVIVQHVAEKVSFELPVKEDSAPDINRYFTDFLRPFDLNHPPLLRAMFVKKNDTSGVLLLDIHHIVSDGISLEIFIRELIAAYSDETLPALKIQFKDYTTWLEQYRHSTGFEAHRQYWLRTFADKQTALNIPVDYPRSNDQRHESGLLITPIDKSVATRLRKIINKEGSTLFLLSLAAYNVLLSKYTGKDNIVVGTPVAGRVHPDLDQLIGMFVNTIPIRCGVDMQQPFTELMEQLSNVFFTALDHQLYPMEELAEHLELVRDMNRNPLFETMFSYHNLNIAPLSSAGINFKALELEMYDVSVKFDLSASITESGDDLLFLVSYSKSLFKESTIAQMAQHYLTILDAVSQSPTVIPDTISISRPDAIRHRNQEELFRYLGISDTAYSAAYPLNTTQRDIYFTCIIDPKGRSLRPLGYHEINEQLDPALWEEAVRQLTAQEDVMHSVIIAKDAEVFQAVTKEVKVNFSFIDISQEMKDATDIPAIVKKYCEEDQDITRDFYKHYLFRINDHHYVTAVSVHHVFTDGTSFRLMIEKTDKIYHALKTGKVSEEKHAPYREDVFDHLEKFDTPAVENFWRKHLAEVQPLTYSGAIATHDRMVADALTIYGDDALLVQRYCETHGVKPHIFFKAVFTLLTRYYCAANHDFCIRENIAGRDRQQLDTIGTYSYVYPLLVEDRFFEGTKSFAELCTYLQQQKRVTNPFRHISLALQNHIIGDEPLSFFYNYQHFLIPATQSNIGTFKRVYSGLNNHMELRVTEQNEGFKLLLDYNEQVFNGENFLARIRLLTTQILEEQLSLNELQYLTSNELQQLRIFGTNAGEQATENVLALFAEQVAKKPDSIALVFKDKKLTYAELDRSSGAIAAHLLELGAGAEDIVGIMVERSEWMIIAMLGVLKAGAAYLPVDPDYPQERINYLLQDSNAKMLLTNAAGKLAHPEAIVLENIPLNRVAPAKVEIHPQQLAYVIYTSGTTGNPKGVLVEHQALSNVNLAWRVAYEFETFVPCSLLMASFSFDVFTGDVIRMLTNGGQIVLCPSEARLDPKSLYDLLVQHDINVFESTPALVVPLMDYIEAHNIDISFLKLLILGSDSCPLSFFRKMLEKYAPGIRVLNSYGVTETCVDSSFYETLPGALPTTGNTPVGKPLLNYTYYVRNAAQQAVPVGLPGELWIGGAGVARGYLNKPDTTAEKFIMDPYTQERVYKTGDVVRWLPDGNIEFLGRKDDQVKVRGFRIELQEIENVILQEPTVKEVAVTVFGQGNEKELVCWYVSESGAVIEDLKSSLKQHLPDYMVPMYFIRLEQLPLTPNGKIDKKAMQDPLHYIDQQSEIIDTPTTATESSLLAIWQDILKRNRIGVLQNFFELGGQSLRAMVLVSRIQKAFAVEISLKDIFTYPTIRTLAGHISNATGSNFAPIMKIAPQSHYPLSSAQKRVFVVSHFKGAEISHNICDVCWINGPLDVSRLSAAFQALTDRHESLRTSFNIVDGEPAQVIQDKLVFHLEHTKGKEEDAPNLVKQFIRKFELSEAPLLRAAVLEVSPDKHLLMFDIHHIISDEVSVGIMLRELWTLYYGEQLPEPGIQYKDYVAWQQSLADTGAIARQQQFWLKQFEGELPVMEFPFDFPRPLTQTFEGGDYSFPLDAAITSRAFNYISEKGITMNMLMLAVYNILLSKYTSLEDIIVGSPVAGRTHADLEPVIGMFVNTLALRSYPTAGKTFEQFLEETKANALAALENQDYPFEELVETLSIKRDPSRNPLFDTIFQFISVPPAAESRELQFTRFPLNISVAKLDLTFLAVQTGEQVQLLLNYNNALFAEASVQRLARHFYNILVQVLDTPAITLQEINLLDEAEIQQLRAFGGSPEKDAPRVTIPALWKESVSKYSEQMAVETTNGSITFGELDRQSTELAICLQQTYQVKPGHKVALMLQRTLDIPVAILAILKTGAAYVPVDPQFPAQRIEYILNNSECTMIVADKDYHYTLPLLNIHAERKDTGVHELAPVNITPDDLAYIIYTSGSTGVPKGAMLEHINVTGFTRNYVPVYGINPGDKILAVSNITFDLSVLEILCSLLSGVCVLLAGDDEINDFPKIAQMLKQHAVNVLQMTPSRLSLFLNTVGLSALSGIKTVITGGEPVPKELFRGVKRCKHVRFFTSCGPTETCIYSTTDEAKEGDERITIGKPLLNEQIFIVGNHGQLQPVNVVGEIYVAGSGVGRGYCNQETLTNEKYFRDESLSTERIYKSGDIGRWLADGRIECLGRKDTQIKLKGYRIELGEIENALGKMEGIGMTAVIVTDIKGEKQIAAFYESEKEYGYSTVRAFLADRLPSYMLPLFCIRVEKMPLTSNGKTDRKALDLLAQKQQAAERPFEEPLGALQKTLATIWQEVLQVERIGATDNFFELGGNSIKLIQVMNRIKKELEVNVPLTTAFTYPTIKALSEKIKMINEFGSVSAEEFYSVVNAGKEPTIFCFPPAIGYSFIYTALAEYFPDHRICCFHFNENDNRMDEYIQVMDEMQPGQPLVLMGYSAGGNFAFEIARELESRGREVSDIILLDSYKRWESKVKTPEEIEATIQAYYAIVDWSIFSVTPDYLETLKKNTMSKIGGYCRYMNGKTDTGATSARIHIVKSKEEWHSAEANRNWEDSSTNGFYIYEGLGLHPEMFNPEYLSHNAGLISTIIQQVKRKPAVHEYSLS